MSQLDYALYHSEQIRTIEQYALSVNHLSEYQLMQQAGGAAFAFFQQHFPNVHRLAVFCGAGNNAGDGYVFARLAQEHGFDVSVYQCKAWMDLPEPARQAAFAAQSSGIVFQFADEPIDNEPELIIDALLGIGVRGAVYGMVAAAITQINASELPVLSLDIPSGLHANTGFVANLCVRAALTFTFIGRKLGMFTLDGPDYCGEIYSHPLQCTPYLQQVTPCAQLLNPQLVPIPLMRRKKNSHKGSYGHVLVIGGGLGMPGAVALAAKAALRAGAGAVSVATRPEHVSAVLSFSPEVMVWGVQNAQELQPLLDKATFCVVGPGLGDSDWAQHLFLAAIASQLPMVIDASALHWLARFPQIDDNWVLTPHPGEAACLLSCTSAQIQDNRYEAAAKLQENYGGVIVLKGVGSIIRTLAKNNLVCARGNPGMASAGMGDVLSGLIAGLAAQGLSLTDAATVGVWTHATAADIIVQQRGECGLLASDLLDKVPYILNGMIDE